MISKSILQKLEKINVWAKHAEQFRLQFNQPSQNYRLEEDEDALKCLQREMPSLYDEIHFDYLPDPVSGDIDAPVCLILHNPGVAEIDMYNYCRVDKVAKDKVVRNLPEYNIEFNFDGEDELRQLENRRNVLLEQYYLKPGTSPYALDSSFDSITLSRKNGGGGRMPRCGSFLWFMALFCKKDIDEARRVARKVFDLEFFPYHTKAFQMGDYIPFEKRNKKLGHALSHSLLRDELIKAFAKDNRIFVVRSQFVRDYLIHDLQVDPDQIAYFRTPRNASFTAKNLVVSQNSRKRLFEFLELD